MSIIEFIIGLLILVASLLASTFCYFVKNEKSGVNAAIGGASDFMATRRNKDNGKLNQGSGHSCKGLESDSSVERDLVEWCRDYETDRRDSGCGCGNLSVHGSG